MVRNKIFLASYFFFCFLVVSLRQQRCANAVSGCSANHFGRLLREDFKQYRDHFAREGGRDLWEKPSTAE